jgi:hypothetical protein
MPYKESNWNWHLQLDGVDCGYWAEKEGGGVDSEDGSYDDWDGPLMLGGKRTRDDVTLRKGYREAVHRVYRWMDARAGDGAHGRGVLTGTPVGDDGVSWGDPIVLTVLLKSVKPPDASKGSSDPGKLEIVLKCDTALA